MKSLGGYVKLIRFLSSLALLAVSNLVFADSPDVAGSSTGVGGLMSGAAGQVLMLGAFFLIFYFLIIRPQNKRAREHRDLLANLSKGDEVTTNGGILGKVTKVGEQYLTLMVSDGVEIRIQKQAITHVMPKGTFQSV